MIFIVLDVQRIIAHSIDVDTLPLRALAVDVYICPTMDRADKRRKLHGDAQETLRSLCRIGSISNKGLEELFRRVRNHPELLDVGHRELTREMHARFEEVRANIRVETISGGEYNWELADGVLLLSKLIRERPHLRQVFLDGLRRHPCSRIEPWKTLVGFDEFTPGDKLKVNSRRKSMVVSFSFAELGPHVLGFDSAWTSPAVVRHATLATVRGGWSQLLTLFLRRLFYGPHGLLVTGLPISDDNGNIIAVVWAKLANLFSDGDGIRAGLDWKGAQGVKPCFCHWNVLQKDSELLEDGDDTYVDITCVDPRRFRRWTQDELYATIDMLNAAWRRNQAGTMTNIALERLEKTSGHNATPYCILGGVEMREALNILEATRYDWMHSALQNGTITW